MAIPKYKDIIALIKSGATIEAQEKIMELRVADLEFQNKNIDLKNRVKELEATLSLRDSLIWQKPYYVDKEKPGEKFCQRCLDADGKSIRLQELETGLWRCMKCENNYEESNYRNTSDNIAITDFDPITGY